MDKRKISQRQATGENQKPASWFVSRTLSSGQELPTGTVTFLFTDIEGSTPHWEHHRDLMEEALKLHNDILFTAIQAHEGKVFKLVGDEFQAAFTTAAQALKAAIDIQAGLRDGGWNELGPIKSRLGLHTGEAHLDDIGDEYAVSHTKNRVGRIRSAAHGGQILLSRESADLCETVLPEGVCLKYLGEFRMKGLTRLEPVYQAVVPGLQEDFPPLSTLTPSKHNLPLELTSFIGREKEIWELAELLEQYRLVTLTGVGGTGKTRLALRTAQTLLEAYPDGIWFAELAVLADPELVPRTLITALGLLESTHQQTLDQLKAYLRQKQALIILDNCEHVIEDCARIVHALLLACPGLKIMATSREALGVTGEVAYPVPSLPVPEASHLPPLEQLAQNPSVRLFEERARAVKPGFAITTDNASAVTQVCKRLDGIPLALELAAARMNAFSPAQIAERLDNRFRLLTGGARTALPRQQTLRASIDWSFSLLEETERLLLLRLSVFQGGWTLELAQEVCAFDGLDEYDVIEGLAQLVNKSLVIAETAPDGSTRYHRLETIRQYAREKLLDSGNSEVLYDRHLEAFLGLVDKARPHLRRHRHLEWLDRLELEMDNLRAALTWALESDVAKGLRIMTSSYWLWHCRGYWLEGEKWFRLLQEKVVALENGVDRALLAEAMGDQAWIMIMAGMWEQRGQRIIDEALSLAQGLGEAHKQLRATLLFFQAYYMGNTKLIRKNVLQSLKIAEEIDDKYLITECLMILANIEPDKAKKKALLERRLRLEEELGDEDGMMTTQLIFGSYYQNFGEVAQAIQMFERGIQMARKLRHSYGWMGGLTSFGKTYYTLGNADKAIETFQQRLHVALDLGEQFHIVQSYYFLGCAYGLKGDWDLAEGYGLQAIEAARINQLSFAEACACFTLAEVAWSLGKDEIAVQFYHKAVGLYGVWDENNFMVGYSAYSSGMEWVLLNDLSSAMKYFQKALRIFFKGEYYNKMADCLEALAFCAIQEGYCEKAVRLHGIAITYLEWDLSGYTPPQINQRKFENSLERVQEALGEDKYAELLKEGQTVAIEEVVAYVQQVLEE